MNQLSMEKIPFWKLVSDVFFVARGLWLFLFFDVLIFVFFILLPQGKDILLAVLEDTGSHFWWTLLFLVLGTVFWGVVAEFGARYTMYVTDNSGDSISDERVQWRKFLQQTFAGFSLYYPPLIILAGLAIMAFSSYTLRQLLAYWYDVFPVLLLFLVVFATLYKLYSKGNNKKPRWLQLPEREEEWTSKLYGIYNPYVFMYPADQVLRMLKPPLETNPWDPHEEPGVRWAAEVEATDTIGRAVLEWPQHAEGDDGKPMVNGTFQLYRFSKKLADLWGRWFYRIPLGYFRVLHRQLLVFFCVCAVLLLLFSVLGNELYQAVGAAGLVTFSFGCWCGVYIGLLFLDKAPLKVKLNYRLLLFVWLLICSWINNDHPVRIHNEDVKRQGQRDSLAEHFTHWLAEYKHTYYGGVRTDSAAGRVYPVVFVCAEGGACRTGAFTAMLLSKLQERYHTLNDRIYAFSSVSGGSLGVGFYNAITHFAHLGDSSKRDSVYTELTKKFFARDHLAAALGKLFFCEIIQLFWPCHIDGFDRAVALEQSWETGYGELLGPSGSANVFGSDYYSVFSRGGSYPAWFINTTCAETGEQCWVANVVPDDLMPLAADRDVWRHLNGTTLYSTAINFSSRFPLVSPSAGVGGRDPYRRHYVDGGYFENLGAQTMADIIRALSKKDPVQFSHVLPIVLVLEYGNDDDFNPKGVRFGNEWTDIVTAIYGTRQGRGSVAMRDLRILTETELHGKMIELPLNESGAAVPLNWLLSERSMQHVSDYCDTVVSRNTNLKFLEAILDTTGYHN